MKFSQRMKLTPVPDAIQTDGMNDELRAGLWNVLWIHEFGKTGFASYYLRHPPRIREFSKALWADHFKLPVDERPQDNDQLLYTIRQHFFQSAWYTAYDFIEFCIGYYGDEIAVSFNKVLERELAGFRVIHGKIAPVSSKEEVKAIQEAISNDLFPGASSHLRTALDLLSNKTKPDYRNSIKESISAVESVSRAITGSHSATLGAALKTLGEKHALHPALRDSFLKLYGYTNDGDGIRHAMLNDSALEQADAIYFLVSCSAFVNYLKTKISE